MVLPREVAFSVAVADETLARPVTEVADVILRALFDAAPERLDQLAFSTESGVDGPRGLLHGVKPSDGGIDMTRADVVYIAAEMPQTLEQRDVLITRALPQGMTVAIARTAVISALGPMRIEARRDGGRVRLRFCAPMGWRAPSDAVAIAHANGRAARWRKILAEARWNVSDDKSDVEAIRYSQPTRAEPSAQLVYKTHTPREVRQPRPRRTERAPAAAGAALPAYAVPEWQIPWEHWLRSHLDNERAQSREEVENIVQVITEATVAFADAVEKTLAKLRNELAAGKEEIAKLAAQVEESRGTDPLDLPKLPLRSAREVN
jgi:hypothetical protein